MQVHGPSVHVENPGQQVSVRRSGADAILQIGALYVHVESPEDADVLIAAAAKAKRLLAPPAQSYGLCPANHLSGVHGCTLQPGHIGPHQSVDPAGGRVRAEWDAEAVCGDRSSAPGHPQCTREPGHKGGHKNLQTGEYWPAAAAPAQTAVSVTA